MPIKVKDDLPAIEALKLENVFVMPETRAVNQDIRPLKVAILNLMPNKVETEIQIIRLLANTPLQVSVDLLRLDQHESKHTPENHLNTFYHYFSSVKQYQYDGLIITGAPLGRLPYEKVTYWPQLVEVLDWAETHATSTLFLCWSVFAALYHHYGLNKQIRDDKFSGVYLHKTQYFHEQLTRGFDDYFWVPHSRYAQLDPEEIAAKTDLKILAQSDEVGAYLMCDPSHRKVFITGHPEYERLTIHKEYCRDKDAGLLPTIPRNYYPNDNPDSEPMKTWRAHAYLLMSNWLNYFVYQETPYHLNSRSDPNAVKRVS